MCCLSNTDINSYERLVNVSRWYDRVSVLELLYRALSGPSALPGVRSGQNVLVSKQQECITVDNTEYTSKH